MASGNITVSYEDERGLVSVRDPYLVNLYVESQSRRDISAKEFDSNKPLVFDLGASIVAPVGKLSSKKTGTLGDDVLTISENTVEISPCLIRKGPMLSLDLLLSGPPHLTHKSPLVDVDVLGGSGDYVFGWGQGAGCLVAIAIIAAGLLAGESAVVSFSTHFYNAHPTKGSYRNYVQHWANIELIAFLIFLSILAIAVIVAVPLSHRRARIAREHREGQP